MTRLCACPCGQPLVGRPERVRYIDERHRQRAYEHRRTIELRSAGLPTSLSKNLARATSGTENRQADAPRHGEYAKSKPSGCQVSYRKAVDAAAAYAMRIVEDHARAQRIILAEHVPESVHRIAEIYMQRALPDRQRVLLAAREQREETTT